MAGQSAHSSTSSESEAARLAKPGGSSSGANCLDPTRSSFRRRSDASSVMGTGITSPKLRGDKKLKLQAGSRRVGGHTSSQSPPCPLIAQKATCDKD